MRRRHSSNSCLSASLVLLLASVFLLVRRNDAFPIVTKTAAATTQWTMPSLAVNAPRDKMTRQAHMGFGGIDDFGNQGNDDNANDGNDDNDDGSLIDYERYKAALEHNTRRTDVRIFLTQRAIQSFINLLITCRDPHTVRWIENTYEFANLENFHGTGAFNLTRYGEWDTILLDMLQRPPDVVIVSARRRGRGHGGWSKNNPYLEDRFVEFEIDIEPPSLVTRILSVRQQISEEWVTDLGTLRILNGQILTSYYERQTQQRDQEEEDCTARADDECIVPGAMPLNEQTSLNRETAFDRNAEYYLNNKIMEESSTSGRVSSPFRKGNFDLLTLLATQEAVHRVLRGYHNAGDERSVSRDWLRRFYLDRLRRHFDGDGGYARADDFLQDLLTAPPTTREIPGAARAQIGLVDPLRIAQDLLQVRAEVIDEWQVIMQQVVPSDHMELQKSILAVRMGKTISNSPSPAPVNNGNPPPGMSLGEGAFE